MKFRIAAARMSAMTHTSMMANFQDSGIRWQTARGLLGRRVRGGWLLFCLAASLLAIPIVPVCAQSTLAATHDLEGNLVTQTAVATVRPPAIVAQPAAIVARTGAAVSFGVTVAGSSPLAYQWKLNGAVIPTKGNASAATATLRLTSVAAGDFGTYQVLVTNPGGSVSSTIVSLQLDSTGSGIADSWKVQYFGANWQTNASAAPGVDADGDGVINFQEYLDGTDPTSSASHFYRLNVTGPVAVSPARSRYAPGTVVTLTAMPEGEQVFNGWTGGVTSAANPLVLTMNQDYAVTAQFRNPYALDPSVAPPTFTQKGNTIINTQVLLADGSVVIGGTFVAVDGVPRFNLARINADSTLNTTFSPPASAAVNALAVQPDGNIVVGGNFGYINGVFSPGLARVSPTGVVDTAFAANVAAFNYGQALNNVAHPIAAVAVRASDGAILAGGMGAYFVYGYAFSVVLNADGTRNTAFNQLASQIGGDSSQVSAVGWEPDGSALIGGYFEQGSATTYSALARLTAAGALDTAFTPAFSQNATVSALAIFSNGDVLAGGFFSQVTGIGRNGIVHLRVSDGHALASANSGSGAIGGPVKSVSIATSGKLLIVGDFSEVNGIERNNVARLNANGSLDTAFAASAPALTMRSVVAVPNSGNVLAAGGFFSYNDFPNVDLVRLKQVDGSVDPAFPAIVTSFNGTRCLAAQPDGKMLVGGNFDYANALPRVNLARINADGSVDTAFLSDGGGTDVSVGNILVLPDRKILIAGGFSTLDGVPTAVPGLARLNPDGSQDGSFTPSPNVSISVSAMAVQPNGQVVLGGSFVVTDPDDPNSTTTYSLIRLNLDGEMDPTFPTYLDGTVSTVVVQPDGQVVIGGSFTTVDGNPGNSQGLARLNADGTPDLTFNSLIQANSATTLALQPDGKLLVGGTFLFVPGDSYSKTLLRLNSDGSLDDATKLTQYASILYGGVPVAVAVQPDGHIIMAGTGLARLNADGSQDTSAPLYGPLTGSTNFPSLTALALPYDGSIVLGSTSLLYFNGLPQLGYTRFVLSAPNVAAGTLAAATNGGGVNLTWTPGATAAPVTSVVMQTSWDGVHYQPLRAAAMQGDGTWVLSLASLPPGISYFRAGITNANLSQAASNIDGPFAAAPVVTSPLTATGTLGVPFGYVATGAYPVTGFAVSGLPTWADYYYSDGNGTAYIFGTPDTLGTSTITLSPSNAAGSTTATLTLTIGQPFSAWAAANFTASELGNPAISGPLGDATGAGIANLIKYALSIPPKRPGVAGLPTVGSTIINGLKYLTLSYTATPSATDITETAEVSYDLDDWESGPGYTTEINRTNRPDGTQNVVVRDNVPMSETAARFIRLRVSQ